MGFFYALYVINIFPFLYSIVANAPLRKGIEGAKCPKSISNRIGTLYYFNTSVTAFR